MTDLHLACECGKVKGVAKKVTPTSGLHVRCFCDDCQAFAKQLDASGDLLDEYGGSEIYQQPLSHVSITEGDEHLACLQLKPNGLFRWHTSCCHTPIGNSFGIKVPYFGIVRQFISDQDFEKKAGPVIGSFYKKFASQPVPKSYLGKHSEFSLILKILSKFAYWKLSRKTHPNYFFDKAGMPIKTPSVIKE